MVNYTFDSAFERTVGLEGGYSDNPNDLGGPTKYGITEQVARRHGFTGSMKELSFNLAKLIYQSDYWNPMRLDDIAILSKDVAEELFDTGVNQGVKQAGTYLQRSLNVLNRQGKDYADLKIDGNIGPKTIAAFISLVGKRGHDGKIVLLRMLNSLQGARYIEISEAREANEEFIFGWFLNRVE